MLICWSCQAENPEENLFCDECRCFLSQGSQKETGSLAIAEVTGWEEKERVGPQKRTPSPPDASR